VNTNNLRGMDVEQVRRLARQLEREANTIEAAVSSLTPRVESAPWKGTDRDHFVSEWSGHHHRRLRDVVDGLRSAARHARDHADQQARISD